jgi:hypothetical protein
MKRIGIVTVFVCLVLLPGIALSNPTHQRLKGMSSAKRNEVWTILFRDGGEKCGTVTESFYQGSYKKDGSAFWNIRCSRGPDYQVMIENDAGGSTKILECAIVKLLHGECFKTFEEMDRQERAANTLLRPGAFLLPFPFGLSSS